jgi:HD-like signal output (HDOD) protein
MSTDPSRDLLHRLERGYDLPPLSAVALRLVELASDDTSSADDLVRLIEKDPSLAVRLLKLANSAFYRTVLPVATLSQAVVKVGVDRLRIMALSLSLRDAFPMGKVGPLDYERFWQVSVYRALISKALSNHVKGTNQEEAFIAGLIMEIGLLIFFDLFLRGKGQEVSLELEPLPSLLAWEKETFGLDHRAVGEAALKHWKFPEHIVRASQRVFEGNTPNENAPPLAKICDLARSFSRLLFYDAGQFHSFFRRAEEVLGLSPPVANDILLAAFDQVMDIAESLSLEIDKERDLMEIMEKANRALSRISQKVSESAGTGQGGRLPSFTSLEDDQETVTRTLQAVAHEIRNPLLAVAGFARRLASSLEPTSEGGKYVKIILEETGRLEAALSEMTHSRGKSP